MSTEELIEFVPRPDALEYATQELGYGGPLCRSLLVRLSRGSGLFETPLPRRLSKAGLSFDDGLDLEVDEGLAIDKCLVMSTLSLMRQDDVCVFEASSSRRGDPALQNWGVKAAHIGDVVVGFVDSSRPNLEELLVKTGGWPHVGVLAKSPHPSLVAGGEILESQLAQLSANAKFVAIAAFDQDGWVVWRSDAVGTS